MKHLKTRLTATLAAATMAVGIATAPAMTASAASYSYYTQQVVYTLPQYFQGFASWVQQQYPAGSTWNTTVYGTKCCKTAFSGVVTQNGYSGSAGFARQIAMDYFGCHTFIRAESLSSTGYAPKMFDQLNANGRYIVVTGYNSNNNMLEYAEVKNGKVCWIQYGTLNSSRTRLTFADGTTRTLTHVDRPLQVGDASGDGNVDSGSDPTNLLYMANGLLNNLSPNVREFAKAACDINNDGQVNMTDFYFISDSSNIGYTNFNGYLKGTEGRFVDQI